MEITVARSFIRTHVTGSLAALVLGAVPLLGVATDSVVATSHQDALEIQGRQRTFLVYAPEASAGNARLPVLIVLHGGLGSGNRVAQQTGLADYVDRAGLLAIFPDAGGEQWNDGRETTDDGVDDVAFLRGVITRATQAWGGDASRVFVAGVSNGGMMAQRMACDAADAITAVTAVVANMPQHLAARCRPSRPIPVMLISSTQDPIMPWDGGVIASSRILGGAGGTVVSALETFKLWSTLDGCNESGVASLANIPVKRHSSENCRMGSEVILYEIDGGGHGWPGGNEPQGPLARRIIGSVTHDISANALLIQFFKQYGL